MFLSCKLIHVFLKRDFFSILFDLRRWNLLHDRLTICIRKDSKSCTILILALPIASLTIGKGKTRNVTIFHSVLRKLLFQLICIAIISMFQSIHCTLISIHGLSILSDCFLLERSEIVCTLLNIGLNVCTLVYRIIYTLDSVSIICKGALQSKLCSFCIIFNRLQSLLITILIGILPHNKSIRSLAFALIFVCKVCRICCKLCITRS